MATAFPNLFSPFELRGLEIRNRIFSTGHGTVLVDQGKPDDRLIAYHEARARGGAGLIVTEATLVHHSAATDLGHMLQVMDDSSLPGFSRLTEAVHRHGCRIFGQLFHPGREVLYAEDGLAPHAWSASATPNERFHVMPREMPEAMVAEVVEAYGAGARRMARAGYDGVEIVASQGYLPAQFLSPRVNRRGDRYGGSLENRVRFLREAGEAARAGVGKDRVLGLRISGDEMGPDGLRPDETLEILALLADGPWDYFNVIAGSSATLGASVHIVPPMNIEPGYVAPFAAAVKAQVGQAVFVAGRINQPQVAERIVATGQADMIGMTRAQIADPELANKAREGRSDDIRACIACNQACIGHILLGNPISCIQHPETGRETIYGTRAPAAMRRRVLVAGGGPAGLKAAAVAAERGHDVTLCEAAPRLGGQVLLAQLLPGRAEFGGLVTNLENEARRAGVAIRLNAPVDRAMVEREGYDAVLVATGARPYRPPVEGEEDAHVVDAWSVIRDEANVGASVVIADWRCDWVGLGLAEKLARAGSRVRLAVNGYMPGQTIQQYVRDRWLGELHNLGVEVIPLVRLYGADADNVYLEHTTAGTPVVCSDVETLVLAQGHESVDTLADELEGWAGEVRRIGDAAAARTAEEAVLDGLKAGSAI